MASSNLGRQSPGAKVVRCPYCAEGNGFKAMASNGEGGDWFMCHQCGHLGHPANPFFECTCAKCVQVRNPKLRPFPG